MIPVLTRRQLLASASGMLTARMLSAKPLVSYKATSEYIEVVQTRLGLATASQRIPSRMPACLTLNSSKQLLFAVNEVAEVDGLPCGSLESYSVHPETGHLELISRQALSLSATGPKHFAVSADDRFIVTAAFGGGLYNVLPVAPTGELRRACQIIKEIGSGPHAGKQSCAHPHSVLFHPSGRFVIGSDLGSDRINVFAFQSGRLTRIQRVEAMAGSGPAQLWLNEAGDTLVVRHEIEVAKSIYHFHAETGRLTFLSSTHRQ